MKHEATNQSHFEWTTPARMISDKLINVYFQEWAPLFPVLHRPTFLSIYGEYTSDPAAIEDKTLLAQLHLVFGIAAHSSCEKHDIEPFEIQWRTALESVIKEDPSIASLQCLVLAHIFCLQKGDYTALSRYRGLAVSLAQRLGLQQSQKRYAFGALTRETRKRIFWTLYTLDW